MNILKKIQTNVNNILNKYINKKGEFKNDNK